MAATTTTTTKEEAWTPWWLKARKKITLRSSDGVEFTVDEKAVLSESETIKNMITPGSDSSDVITINNVTGSILELVVDYFTKCVAKPRPPRNSGNEAFNARFSQLDDDTLLQLMVAAHHLKVKVLFNRTAHGVAEIFLKKSIEERREWLSTEDDYTPEEKEELEEKFRKIFYWLVK